MKKILFISAAFVGMLFVTSCSNSDNPTPAPTQPTYLEVLFADNAAILKNYPAFEGYFREAQYELNGIVAETLAEDLKPVSVNYVYA